MSRPVRSSRPRSRVERRAADAAVAPPPAPAPAGTTPQAAAADASAHTSTRITTTDYGYVVGELRRLAILTVCIIALLLVIWQVVG